MPKSRNTAIGDLNMAIGEFFASLADLFADAAQKRFWRAGENYYQDAVDLALVAKGIAGELDSIGIVAQDGRDIGKIRQSIDPSEPILPLAHPIVREGDKWVYGVPPKGTFNNGGLDEPPDNSR